MKAVRVERLDGPSALVFGDVPDAEAGPDQVLIEVHAAGVTFPDVLQSQGRYQYKPELPFVLGSTVAGIVRQAPPTSALHVGQRVCALPSAGGFAELAVAAPSRVFVLPEQLSLAAAAAAPFNYLTVQFAFTRRARLQSGETVLVHGAGGGLGSAAVQFAHAVGARVIAVVSSAEKGDVAVAAGAHDVVTVEGFRDTVSQLTGGRGVDVIFDPVGGDRFTDSLRSLATEGRLLVVGFTGGEIPTVRVNRLLLNNLDVVGVGWGAYLDGRPEYLQEQWQQLLPLFAGGALRPVIGANYSLAEAADAVSALDNRQAVGNVVLTVR